MKGYSLIELLIVITLIAITSYYSLPSLQQMFQKNSAQIQVNQLLRIFNYARNLAVISAKIVIVCPASTTTNCGKDWNDGIRVYIKINNSTQLLEQSLANFNSATLTWNRSSNYIIFSPTGFLQSQNGSFNYKHNFINYERRILLSSTGRIRLVEQ